MRSLLDRVLEEADALALLLIVAVALWKLASI
jgi:hypothetical protein